MSDISKCTGEGCSIREQCWRYKAPSNEFYQSFTKPPVKGPKCNLFWEIDPPIKPVTDGKI